VELGDRLRTSLCLEGWRRDLQGLGRGWEGGAFPSVLSFMELSARVSLLSIRPRLLLPLLGTAALRYEKLSCDRPHNARTRKGTGQLVA
jgi:hypothetical protein